MAFYSLESVLFRQSESSARHEAQMNERNEKNQWDVGCILHSRSIQKIRIVFTHLQWAPAVVVKRAHVNADALIVIF